MTGPNAPNVTNAPSTPAGAVGRPARRGPSRRHDADLLVAGGGPAGLATALYAARAGLSVIVLDPRPAPVDKACGEGLMPGGVRALDALGVQPRGMPLSGIEYADLAGRRARAPFRAGCGLGVRRTELHSALAEAADAAGAERRRSRVTGGIRQDGDGVTAAGLRARWLVAADGLHSPVRRSLGIPVRRRTPHRFGLRRHWRVPPWTDAVQVVWGPHGEAYVTPVGPELVGVAVLYRPGRHGAPEDGGAGCYEALLRGFPPLAERLAGAHPAGGVRGAGPMRQQPARRVVGRVLLVGDAAGYEDALTGEGLSLAFAQAEAAVAALTDGAPEAYARRWTRLTRRYRLLTRGLLLATAPASTRGLLLPCAAAAPGLFAAAVDQLARP